MNKPPAFQFYADDFIGGTVCFSAQEVGAYMRLLCYQWGNGSIPNDAKTLKRIAGVSVSKSVQLKFPNGINPRLEAERQKQQLYREKQAAKGRASAHARFNHGSTTVQPSVVDVRLQPEGNSPISDLRSPVSIDLITSEKGEPSEARSREFERPNQADFVAYMIEKAGVPADYAAERWGRFDSVGWVNGNGVPVKTWKSLAPSLQNQFRADAAKPARGAHGRPPVRTEAERDAEKTGLPKQKFNLKLL